MKIFLAVPALAALFLWVSLVATDASLNSSDAAGNGLAEVYAVFGSFALWVLLAMILIVAGIKGRMSKRSMVCAALLLPGSCAASVAAIEILKHARDGWVIAAPALAPPLLLAYAAWLYLPALRVRFSPRLAEGVTWGILLVLSLAPWPAA